MRLSKPMLIAPLAAAVAACTQADAATLDPQDDVHCSVVAFYWRGWAELTNQPAYQQQAADGIHEWYAAKIRKIAKARWGSFEKYGEEVQPLLDEIKKDPLATGDAMMTCTKRATSDPGFKDFAEQLEA